MDGEDLIIALIIAALTIVIGRKMGETYEEVPAPPILPATPTAPAVPPPAATPVLPPPVTTATTPVAPAMTSPPPTTPVAPPPPATTPLPDATSTTVGKVFDKFNFGKLSQNELQRKAFMMRANKLAARANVMR
jgi:hypothetical protein